ncbi:MAG: hypothetical protein QM831_14595 [Kofleriaceae bacterium]
MKSWAVPAAEILTVGLPFCAFKLLTGVIAGVPGYALLAWGAIDAVLNLINLAALITVHRRVAPVCLLAIPFKGDIGLAIDVFVSFGFVAIVVGASLLGRLPAWTLPIWNIAVVLNVLGAGVGRLLGAVRRV